MRGGGGKQQEQSVHFNVTKYGKTTGEKSEKDK